MATLWRNSVSVLDMQRVSAANLTSRMTVTDICERLAVCRFVVHRPLYLLCGPNVSQRECMTLPVAPRIATRPPNASCCHSLDQVWPCGSRTMMSRSLKTLRRIIFYYVRYQLASWSPIVRHIDDSARRYLQSLATDNVET